MASSNNNWIQLRDIAFHKCTASRGYDPQTASVIFRPPGGGRFELMRFVDYTVVWCRRRNYQALCCCSVVVQRSAIDHLHLAYCVFFARIILKTLRRCSFESRVVVVLAFVPFNEVVEFEEKGL